MSRKIAIVGAGQSGLQTGIGLLKAGYDVSILSSRTGEQIQSGKVTSSQCMFDKALQNERDLGIHFWDDRCPDVEGIGLRVTDPANTDNNLIEWAARLDKPAQSVDQRVKIPVWMDEFVRLGGDLQIRDVDIDVLEELARQYELILIAAGKGDIAGLFERDDQRSTFDKPQRALALTHVHGMKPSGSFSRVAFNLIPGIGEYFCFPALTNSGPCEIMVFEGIPDGPMDCWQDVNSPREHLSRSLEILNAYMPVEASHCQSVELTDENGIIIGRFSPTVRKPVATLPSGVRVMGIADVLVLNDPITGQGSNNASKCSRIYLDAIKAQLDAIKAQEDRPFNESWMRETFESYWAYVSNVVEWTNSLLLPPPQHILELLGAAQNTSSLACRIVNGFNDPSDLMPWWKAPAACGDVVSSYRHASS